MIYQQTCEVCLCYIMQWKCTCQPQFIFTIYIYYNHNLVWLPPLKIIWPTKTFCCKLTNQYAVRSSSDSSAQFLYIQMELCDKRTLKVWIDERNSHRDPKRRQESLHITKQIVHGVEYIHSKKLIHRDLKVSQLLSNCTVTVIEFTLKVCLSSDLCFFIESVFKKMCLISLAR